MYKIRDNRWNRRFCKWMASFLMAALLVNQSSILTLAEETVADTVIVTDEGMENLGAGEETKEPDAGEDEDTEADTDTAPDIAADEETDGSDAGEGEDADADIGSDTDDISDVDVEDEVNTLSQDDEAGDVVGEDVVSPAAEEDDFTYNDILYRIIGDENALQVEVAGHADGTSVSGDLDIPATASDGTNWYTVVGIGDSAFKGCDYLTGITVPDGVTSIGSEAFRDCIRLKNISIPDSVTSIGEAAFDRCALLESITIPGGITSIENQVFWSCESLKSITIPNSVTSIGVQAFSNCRNLKSITIPDSVTSIGEAAFEWCDSLESITIPDGITSIKDFTFSGCASLKSITIPDGVTSIGAHGFSGCGSLESITIPDGVTSIGALGFDQCISLKNITIPDSVTSIGASAFNRCTGLKSITIPEGITSIGSYTFYQCGSLTNVIIPNSVTSVESHAFHYCSSLESVTILNDNISIAGGVFWNCKNLNILKITLSENITGSPGINGNCFPDCPKKNPLIFLTKDGTTELGPTTIPTLAAAVEAYDAADGIDDGMWYGWKLPDVPDEEKLFTITASAGTGGSVSPSGDVKVKSGADQRFTVTPEEGYRITSILVDNVEQLDSAQTVDYTKAGITDAENNAKYYDFENVTGDHTLAASFEAIQGGDGDDSGTGDGDDGGSGDDIGGGDGGGSGGTGGGDDNSGSGGIGGGDTGSSGGDTDSNSSTDGSGNIIAAISSDMSVASDTGIVKTGSTASTSQSKEPKTGDSSHMEIYATIAMIAGLFYILLSFVEGKCGMTEEEKQEVVAALMNWAKKGGHVRKYAALAVIFLVLVYYHSIGKRTSADWKEIYEN